MSPGGAAPLGGGGAAAGRRSGGSSGGTAQVWELLLILQNKDTNQHLHRDLNPDGTFNIRSESDLKLGRLLEGRRLRLRLLLRAAGGLLLPLPPLLLRRAVLLLLLEG